MKAITIGVAVLLGAATHTSVRADAPQKKTLRVNHGTRAKNQYQAPIESVAVGFGERGPGMTGDAYVRIEGPNLTPQCVIHLGTLTEALALAAQIESDQLISIACQDERDPGPTVIIEHPPRPGDQSKCPRTPGCTGQSVDLRVRP